MTLLWTRTACRTVRSEEEFKPVLASAAVTLEKISTQIRYLSREGLTRSEVQVI